jgi:DNA-binding protein H-NS
MMVSSHSTLYLPTEQPIKGIAMDLSKLSFDDLCALQDQVTKEIKRREQEKIIMAREQIIAIAEHVGIPLKELVSGNFRGKSDTHTKKTKKGVIRYRHPSDNLLQWSGHGRQPRWIKDWIESGQPLEALRV